MSFEINPRKEQILKEVLELSKESLHNHDCFGYDMPDGKHHIFIYQDQNREVYVIEPNTIVDGGCEPMGDTFCVPIGDDIQFRLGCSWCLEQFEWQT